MSFHQHPGTRSSSHRRAVVLAASLALAGLHALPAAARPADPAPTRSSAAARPTAALPGPGPAATPAGHPGQRRPGRAPAPAGAGRSPQVQRAPAASVAGTVRAPDGAPLAGVPVTVVPMDGGPRLTTTTGEDGRYTLSGLPSGSYRILVAHDGLTAGRRVRLGDAPVTDADLQLRLPGPTAEVTVTATGTARDTDRVPGEVSVVTRDDVEGRQARSLDDVLRTEPGVEIGGARRLAQAPNVRGLDAERVLVLLDGVRISQFTSGHKGSLFLDPWAVERIEVVRGPASALYGSGALGGVLSIRTRTAESMLEAGETLAGTVGLGYSGAHGEWMASPRVFGSLGDGSGFVLGYTGRRNDGTVELAGEPPLLEAAEEDVDSLDGRLALRTGEAGTLELSANALDTSGSSSINLDSVVVGPEEAVERTTRRQTVRTSWRGSGGPWWRRDLRVQASYSHQSIDELRPLDGRSDTIEFRTLGVDARNTVGLGRHALTFGVEAFQDRESSRRDGQVNTLFPEGTQSHVGVFVQDELTVGRRLRVVPGLRLDSWTSSPGRDDLTERSDRRLNPKLGATFEVAGGLVASASYAEGFRAPGFQELYISGTHFDVPLGPGGRLLGIFVPNPDLAPESSRNVDVGLRYRRGGLSARVAWYRSWVDDFIETVVTEGFVPPGTVLLSFTDRNVQSATLHGVEAAFDWQIDRRWGVWGNLSRPRGADDTSGAPLASVPPAKAALGVEWRALSTDLRAGLTSRIRADQDEVPEGIEPTEGTVLHDVHASWSPGFLPAVTLHLAVDNLADTDHTIPLFGTPGTGRDVRAGLTFRFTR